MSDNTFSVAVKVEYYEFTWSIGNFAKLCTSLWIKSKVYKIGFNSAHESKWFFEILPEDLMEGLGRKIHIIINFQRREAIDLTFRLCIRGHRGMRSFVTDFKKLQCNKNCAHYLLHRSDLLDNTDLYLPNGTLTICCSVRSKVLPYYWNMEQQSQLCKNFSCMLSSACFFDVTLNTRGQVVRAHKAVIAAQSKVFFAMFKHDTLESQTNKVDIIDIDKGTMLTLLNYMYGADIDLENEKHAIDVFIAADKYGLEGLLKRCVGHLIMNMSVENVLYLFLFSEQFNDFELKVTAMNFLRENEATVEKSQDWITFRSLHPVLTDSMFSISN